MDVCYMCIVTSSTLDNFLRALLKQDAVLNACIAEAHSCCFLVQYLSDQQCKNFVLGSLVEKPSLGNLPGALGILDGINIVWLSCFLCRHCLQEANCFAVFCLLRPSFSVFRGKGWWKDPGHNRVPLEKILTSSKISLLRRNCLAGTEDWPCDQGGCQS